MTERAHYITDPNLWAEQIVEQFFEQQDDQGAVLVADICGTLVDADYSFHQYYVGAATHAGLKAEDIADIDTFRADGHRAHLGHPNITPDYGALKQRLMLDSDLHASMPPMANSVELAEKGTKYGLPHAYLSTRPEIIGEATYHNLRSHGFTESPMLLRAEGILYAETISFKVGSLAVLRAALDAHHLNKYPVVFVDDYPQLVRDVNQSDMNVLGVHFTANTSWSAIARDYLGIQNF